MEDQIKQNLIKECRRQMEHHYAKRLDTYNKIKCLDKIQIQNQKKQYSNGSIPACNQDRMLIGYLFQELCKCKTLFENLEHLRGADIKRHDESLDKLDDTIIKKNEEIAKLKRQLEANNPINPNPEYIGEGIKDLNTTLNNQLGMMNETLKQIHYGMP